MLDLCVSFCMCAASDDCSACAATNRRRCRTYTLPNRPRAKQIFHCVYALIMYIYFIVCARRSGEYYILHQMHAMH